MPEIKAHSLVVVSKNQVSCNLAGEATILNPQNGTYYGLEEVGTTIWSFLGQPITVASIKDALLQEFDVDAKRCEQDLLSLLDKLADEGLIEVRDGEGA